MQKPLELEWVGYVLRDVVTFLAENEMMQSAQMLAVAAAHIEHDIKRNATAPPAVDTPKNNVVNFPTERRCLN